MNGFWWYLAGFATATGLALWWHRGVLKPRLDALKDIAERALRAKAAEMLGK